LGCKTYPLSLYKFGIYNAYKKFPDNQNTQGRIFVLSGLFSPILTTLMLPSRSSTVTVMKPTVTVVSDEVMKRVDRHGNHANYRSHDVQHTVKDGNPDFINLKKCSP
jgi:hypothetical protein